MRSGSAHLYKLQYDLCNNYDWLNKIRECVSPFHLLQPGLQEVVVCTRLHYNPSRCNEQPENDQINCN